MKLELPNSTLAGIDPCRSVPPPAPLPAAPRTTMNGKPVIAVAAKSIVNFQSNFRHKLLCDGLTFSTGSACCFSCAFCYVPDLMRKNPHGIANPRQHADLVIRRLDPVALVRRQLTYRDGRPRFSDPSDRRVIYASPLVDVAANLELVQETIAVCREILTLTSWQIRLLSKSNLLPRVAGALTEFRDRIIFGVSTGTLDDGLAVAYESGTPRVSKRIESLHWLQDHGYRTFGMVCPSLPLADEDSYRDFAARCVHELRLDRCEHCWAEVLNVRGESMVRTCRALRDAGFGDAADRVARVATDKRAWEDYARQTFAAHASAQAAWPGKLRFLQYVNRDTRPYWEAQRALGAVLL